MDPKFFAYEDGTFWAIAAYGSDCFTSEDSVIKKPISRGDEDLYDFVEVDTSKSEEERDWFYFMPNPEKISFADPDTAEREAQKMAAEKSKTALKYSHEFWLTIIEARPKFLRFVPEEYRTKELYTLAVRKDRHMLSKIPAEIQTAKLCRLAISDYPFSFQCVREDLMSSELCEEAVRRSGFNFEFVPERFITPELCLKAVKHHGSILAAVPEKFITMEMCIDAVSDNPESLKFVPDKFKTIELCFLAAIQNNSSFFDDECILEYVPEALKTYEFYLVAIITGCLSLKHVPHHLRTAEMCRLLFIKHGEYLFGEDVLQYMPEDIRKNYA